MFGCDLSFPSTGFPTNYGILCVPFRHPFDLIQNHKSRYPVCNFSPKKIKIKLTSQLSHYENAKFSKQECARFNASITIIRV